MKDPEFIELKNRVLLGIGICILLLVPLFLFMHNTLIDDRSYVIKRIDNKDTFLILVTDNNCKYCKYFETKLKDSNIDYNKINIDKDSNYPYLLQKLDISSSEIIPPSIIHIVDGSLFSTLVDIKTEEAINQFIENLNLES